MLCIGFFNRVENMGNVGLEGTELWCGGRMNLKSHIKVKSVSLHH